MYWLKTAAKIIAVPLIKYLFGAGGIIAIFLAGKRHQKLKNDSQQYKRLKRNLEVKNAIKHDIDTTSRDDIINRLYDNWERPSE